MAIWGRHRLPVLGDVHAAVVSVAKNLNGWRPPFAQVQPALLERVWEVVQFFCRIVLMDHLEAGNYWERNAPVWTRLARARISQPDCEPRHRHDRIFAIIRIHGL